MRYFQGMLRPIIITAILGVVSYVLDHFELNYGWLRACCLAILWATVLILKDTQREGTSSVNDTRALKCFSIVLLLIICTTVIIPGLSAIPKGPQCDVGWTTRDAVHELVREKNNPYESDWIGKIGDDPRFWGYHYGPGTILAYLPAELLGNPGVNILNLVYFIATFIIIASLLLYTEPVSQRSPAILFALTLFCLPVRMWYEPFRQGATDILPVGLILASVLCIHKRFWFLSGLLAGYSISCKFIP